MGVGGNCVTAGYISSVTLAWFPMEKIDLWLCCVTVRSSHAENFEPVGQYDSGMEVTNMLRSCTFCGEKGVEESESCPWGENCGVTLSVSVRRSCTSDVLSVPATWDDLSRAHSETWGMSIKKPDFLHCTACRIFFLDGNKGIQSSKRDVKSCCHPPFI